MHILTLNCGSSSLKYQLYDWDNREVLAKGIVERVTVGDSFIEHYARGRGTAKREKECPDHKAALELIIETLTDPEIGAISDLNEIKAVGHRVVHGGEKFAQSVIIDDEALDTFRTLADLAPLHNPPNITGIEAAREVMPRIPHCAIMDTAWHQTMPAHAYIYALPYSWYENYGVRRYGFHGTSFLYVAKRAAVLLGRNPFECNLILLHIGNGASANAVRGGISVDTSMGLTPLEGLVMGTRAGDHDPAIGYYVLRKESLAPEEVEQMLNKKSGILGITEIFTDRRDVETAAKEGDRRAELAIEIESYRLKKYIGAYIAALGRVDALVFTAGVGERGPHIREKAVAGLETLGIKLDPRKNELSRTRNAETLISTLDSPAKIFVIPTDEELVMTEDTYALLQGTYKVHTDFSYSFQHPGYRNKERTEALAEELDKNPELAGIIATPAN
ncbi:MAG: acetate kinase [Spirochaetaceae bacterium]|nr:MAG: acetate kinase [Spirochaetaceae bacterium]